MQSSVVYGRVGVSWICILVLLIREKFGLTRRRDSAIELHFKNTKAMKAFLPVQEPQYDITTFSPILCLCRMSLLLFKDVDRDLDDLQRGTVS